MLWKVLSLPLATEELEEQVRVLVELLAFQETISGEVVKLHILLHVNSCLPWDWNLRYMQDVNEDFTCFFIRFVIEERERIKLQAARDT